MRSGASMIGLLFAPRGRGVEWHAEASRHCRVSQRLVADGHLALAVGSSPRKRVRASFHRAGAYVTHCRKVSKCTVFAGAESAAELLGKCGEGLLDIDGLAGTN